MRLIGILSIGILMAMMMLYAPSATAGSNPAYDGNNDTRLQNKQPHNNGMNDAYHSSIPEDGQIAFEIRMDGDPVGTHRLMFSDHPDGIQVDITIKITVRLGPIPVYRYTHENTEIWDHDTLIHMDSHTYDNGNTHDVMIQRADDDPDTLDIRADRGVYYSAPIGTLATTYWNRATIKQDQLINSQDGQLIDINTVITDQSDTTSTYYMTGPDNFEVYVTYNDDTNQWAGLEFTRKGRDFTYHRIDK